MSPRLGASKNTMEGREGNTKFEQKKKYSSVKFETPLLKWHDRSFKKRFPLFHLLHLPNPLSFIRRSSFIPFCLFYPIPSHTLFTVFEFMSHGLETLEYQSAPESTRGLFDTPKRKVKANDRPSRCLSTLILKACLL
jgi:hypothetical protein